MATTTTNIQEVDHARCVRAAASRAVSFIEMLEQSHGYEDDLESLASSNGDERNVENNKDLELRLIGPLQTNKVKQSLDLFNVIETIDREKLAIEISKNYHSKVRTKCFYIQINTGNEPQKSGLDPLLADSFIDYCIKDLNLPIVGLMCIPPKNQEPSMHFVLLQKIANRNNLPELSMGMSSDYEDAIKFGATSVRIGSLLFGERKI